MEIVYPMLSCGKPQEKSTYIEGGSPAVYHISLSFRGPQMNRQILIDEVSVYLFFVDLTRSFMFKYSWCRAAAYHNWKGILQKLFLAPSRFEPTEVESCYLWSTCSTAKPPRLDQKQKFTFQNSVKFQLEWNVIQFKYF